MRNFFVMHRLFYQAPYSFHRFLRVFLGVEGGQAEIAAAVFAEALAGRTDNGGVFEQIVKERPAAHVIGAAQPDVRRVFAAGVIDAQLVERGGYYLIIKYFKYFNH